MNAFKHLRRSSCLLLEKVASSLGIGELEPIWQGWMNEYSVRVLGDSYVSPLAAGILSIIMTLATTFALGTAIKKRNRTESEKP